MAFAHPVSTISVNKFFLSGAANICVLCFIPGLQKETDVFFSLLQKYS